MSPTTVVVPLDFSDESERAFQKAIDIAGDASAIRAVHVLFPLDAVSPGVAWGGITDESREKAVREEFEKLQQKLGQSGIQFDVRIGNPGLEITDFASEINADLIVVASHGYHGFKRMVLGSVAERIIRHAACDVLVLRRSDAE